MPQRRLKVILVLAIILYALLNALGLLIVFQVVDLSRLASQTEDIFLSPGSEQRMVMKSISSPTPILGSTKRRMIDSTEKDGT
jgi:hypothetical protein